NSLAQVFFAHGAEAYRETRFNDLYIKLQNTLFSVGLPPALILVVIGPELFEFIFGDEWKVAGNMAQWLAISTFFSFVVSPLSQIFIITEKQKISMILQFILFTSRLVGILLCVYLNDLILSILFFTVASVFGYTLY